LGNKLFKNFGFNVEEDINTSYLWQSSMVDGIDAATVIDAQNYGIPSLKSTLKLVSNICWKEYGQVLEGLIGQQILLLGQLCNSLILN
jgi:hypothetical protein